MSDYCAIIQTIVCNGNVCSKKVCSENMCSDNMCSDSVECEELKGSVSIDFCEQTACISRVMVKTLFAKVQLLVNDEDMAVLIDTGSTVNAVTNEVVERLECPMLPLTDVDYTECTLANGASEVFLGKVKLMLKFPDFLHETDFYVMPSAYESVILGCETLNVLKAEMSLCDQSIKFHDNCVVNVLSMSAPGAEHPMCMVNKGCKPCQPLNMI